ncbi:membrane biogenesis protein [Candidatus Woesearchaeota archaeon]|nr:membrane biogenesis protein [Candidatus Woesearchaeota archaeon]
MQLNTNFKQVFGVLPILGMIHLAGDDPVKNALEELVIFEEEGITGAIIENYHGSVDDVVDTLKAMPETNLVIGMNILPNEFDQAFPLASKYGADFIQLDHVAGSYREGNLDFVFYKLFKEEYSQINVLGGVWPKYYKPKTGSILEKDLSKGIERAEAIVVTGEGTGKETPLEKIKKFKQTIGNHPLIVGAGLTPENAFEQLSIADGAIVGSCLKQNNSTYMPIDRSRVKELMTVVREVRKMRK